MLRREARFECPSESAVDEGVGSVDWSAFIEPTGTLWVDAQTKDSVLDHSRYLQQRVKDVIVDQVRAADGTRPSVDRDTADVRVHLHLYRDRATLSVDTSGASLHRRGWRNSQGRAPLAETLAAACVLRSGWDRRGPLLDPFCGTGTLLVEGAMIAAGMAPGLSRERFGFETWRDHDAAGWASLRDEALFHALMGDRTAATQLYKSSKDSLQDASPGCSGSPAPSGTGSSTAASSVSS